MAIGIIGAMDEEVALLKEEMQNVKATTIAGCEFFEGTLEGHDVVLLKCGIGKVNAAIGTTLLLQAFPVSRVINTGSAGGFHAELNVGDVVIGSEVRHHDVDVTAFGYEYGQVPQLPAFYTADSELTQAAKQAAEKTSGSTIIEGLIASGDAFMNDPVRVEFVRGKFPSLAAAEMEAAAIAQVCHQFSTPFVIIRSLSDIAGKDTAITFEQFLETAAKNSASFILNMLKEIH